MTKSGISLVIGFLVACIVFFFTQQDILNVKNSDILYVKKGPIAPGIVHLSQNGGEEFSFFINVFIPPKQDHHGAFIVMLDRINQISFFVQSNGIPGIQWKSKNPMPLNKTHRRLPNNKRVSRNKWNHVGFVYRSGRITTFVNGNICRETLTANKAITLSHLELLPETGMDGTVEEYFSGKATYPILLTKALTLPHIQELLKGSRSYHQLTLKIFLIFLFGFLVSFFALIPLFLPFISRKDTRITGSYQVKHNVLYMLSIHFIFFLVFNSGYSAARYINLYFSNRKLWNPGAYFTFLVVIGFLFILSLALEKITGAPASTCFVYGLGVMSLLMFNVLLCLLPHFNHIYPLIFNGLFSICFSMIAAAPNILGIRMKKVGNETRQTVHQA